jgi:hypothetical protein
MKVSAAIISHLAAAALDRCLASLDFADEIVVLVQTEDAETSAVCVRHGAVLHRADWLGFGPMKQKAVSLCRNDWVLSVDSDEELTPELRAAITALPDEPTEAAFAVNRLSRFLGRWIRHCGWHPEYVVRLFDRRRAAFNDRRVHEGIETTGHVSRLPGIMLHYTYDTMEQYIEKLNLYTTLAAEDRYAAGKRASPAEAIARSQATFWRMWLLQSGWRDGWPGTLLCCSSAFYVLSKYIKLWRMGRR